MKRVGLLLLTAVAMASTAYAEKVIMNFGWEAPVDSDYGFLAQQFKDKVEQYSGGSIEVKLHCCGQISTEDTAFKAMQLGTVDAFIITQNNVAPHWPLMNVFVLPYVFESQEHVNKVTGGEVGQQIRDQLLADTGVHLLTFGGAGYRDLFNSQRPIETFEDFAGLKYRVPKNQVMIETFKAFGSEPVPIAWSETPTALQTRAVDGGDNGTWVIKSMKFYEFADNLTILEHFLGFSPAFASGRFMNKLDDEQRAALQKAMDEAGALQAEKMARETDEIREWLKTEGGMTVTYPDKTPFIEAAQSVQDKFASEGGEQFQALLEKIRAAAP